MEILLALASGVLYAAGIYLMLRRRLAQLIIGLGLLSNGTNLLIFTAGGLTRARPPVVPEGAAALVPPYADPVPQALVLTAIVIGFGLAGLLAGAGPSRARDGRHRRRGRRGAGAMRMLVLPILVPLTTAAVLLLAPKRPAPQRWISLAGSVLLLASAVLVFLRVNAAGIQVLQISGWPAPFGITLVADLLAAMLVVAVGVVGVAVTASPSPASIHGAKRSATTR